MLCISPSCKRLFLLQSFPSFHFSISSYACSFPLPTPLLPSIACAQLLERGRGITEIEMERKTHHQKDDGKECCLGGERATEGHLPETRRHCRMFVGRREHK